ncbi:helix-turn-helix domain-containing protein [Paenibacillus sp. R14(2021)]|uniref:helix-turn-helix domain-containing protein n=1 Tax=Paenibacillus sp. R14(2021) TaxID=2859228 RepID=UPI001C613775|nr:helix-turn-helix domain-containing protein [Paenibacillus sp. R14(2021)]
MNQQRDYGTELDVLKEQFERLQEQLDRITGTRPRTEAIAAGAAEDSPRGTIHFAGSFRQGDGLLKWEAQERAAEELLQFDSESTAKILAALGHKQRLDILRALLGKPQTGAALVEQLQMGTTGQLYHHIKALAGADLLQQEERGGAYTVQPSRLLPILLLLSASHDLRETSDYLDMTAVRDQAGDYLGSASAGKYDPHILLWAVLENSIMEHEAGFCSEVNLFLHADGTVTIADNSRGIPVSLLSGTGKTWLHTVMTDLQQLFIRGAVVTVPGSAKGINIAVVNAMTSRLQVEARREGVIVRQSYKHGIPQHPPLTIGVTGETGTSVTLEPDAELFTGAFDSGQIMQRAEEIMTAFPNLTVRMHT